MNGGLGTRRWELLGSPVFIGALALLLLNDFVLKAAFHNWLTGKLSDFSGLVAFALFGCALWPERRLTVATAVTLWFVYWKSPVADGLIEAANHILPFAIGRTVDYTDLVALAAAWLACHVALRLRPWPLRRWAVQAIAGVSFFAFAATSYIPSYNLRESARLPQDQRLSEAAVQDLVDRLATRHDLQCAPCEPISTGRLYTNRSLRVSDFRRSAFKLLVLFDRAQAALIYDIRVDALSAAGPPDMRLARALRADLGRELQAAFPEITFAPAALPQIPPTLISISRGGGASHAEGESDAARALALIGGVAAKNGMKRDDLAADLFEGTSVFYAGSLIGTELGDREIILWVGTKLRHWEDPIVRISIEHLSSEYETIRRALTADLKHRLQAEFGPDRIVVHEGSPDRAYRMRH